MDSILMIVAALIVVLIVLVGFWRDDDEDDEPAADGVAAGRAADARRTLENVGASGGAGRTRGDTVPAGRGIDEIRGQPAVRSVDGTAGSPATDAGRSGSMPAADEPGGDSPMTSDPGGETDLVFRALIEHARPPVTGMAAVECVVGVIQVRCALDEFDRESDLIELGRTIDQLLDPALAPFPLVAEAAPHQQWIWLFGHGRACDDPRFEAVVSVHDLLQRARRAAEDAPLLAKARFRLAAGIAAGRVWTQRRGVAGMVGYGGKTLFLAETLAEAAGDSQCYVDESVYGDTAPFFDFREWKPVKLRPSLPPVAFYLLLGVNEAAEIATFASHEDPARRRAVAVIFRYLNSDDIGPLLGLVGDPVEEVALAALESLYELGDARALSVLKKALHDAGSPRLRAAIVRAIGATGSSELLPVLLASARDSRWQVRYQAVEAIHRVAGPETTRHLAALGEDADGAVRALIARIRYQIEGDPRYLEALHALLADPSTRARRHAVRALLAIGNEAALALATRGIIGEEERSARHEFIDLLASARGPGGYSAFLRLFAALPETDRPRLVAALLRSGARPADPRAGAV